MTTPKLEMATLTHMEPRGVNAEGTPIVVQFNPQSLQINYTLTGKRGSVAPGKALPDGTGVQATNQPTDYGVALSSLSLFFDTTETGANVQNITRQITSLLMLPDQKAAPKMRFQWGAFIFIGTMNSAQETLDYFSPEGVPLRATVTLGLTYTPDKDSPSTSDSSGGGIAFGASLGVNAGASLSAGISASMGLSASANVNFGAAVGTSPLTLAASGDSIQNISIRAGVDWKAVASANGIDNPRKLQAGAVLNLNVKGGK